MEHKGSNRFFDGFVWGMVIGGTLALLFATKKGKRIVKELSEAGGEILENLSTIEEQMEPEDEYVAETRSEPVDEKGEMKEGNNGHSFKKRFFRGIKKR